MLLQKALLTMLDILEQRNGELKGRENLERVISEIPDTNFDTKILWDTAELTATNFEETITRSDHGESSEHLKFLVIELIDLAKKLHPGVTPPLPFVTFAGTIFLSFIQNLHSHEKFSLITGKHTNIIIKLPSGPSLN